MRHFRAKQFPSFDSQRRADLGGSVFCLRKICHFERFLRAAGTLVVTLVFCKGPTDVFCRHWGQLWKILKLNPGWQQRPICQCQQASPLFRPDSNFVSNWPVLAQPGGGVILDLTQPGFATLLMGMASCTHPPLASVSCVMLSAIQYSLPCTVLNCIPHENRVILHNVILSPTFMEMHFQRGGK